jgi:hypothetical protein
MNDLVDREFVPQTIIPAAIDASKIPDVGK